MAKNHTLKRYMKLNLGLLINMRSIERYFFEGLAVGMTVSHV